MSVLPNINDPVCVRTWAGAEFPSRIEDQRGALICVAAPLDPPVREGMQEGAELLLTWTAGDGVAVLPVKLALANIADTIPLWGLRPIGEVWREQRREFVRVDVDGPMTMSVPGPQSPEPQVLNARLVDIGEAALQAAVTSSELSILLAGHRRPLAEGTVLLSSFRLGETDFALSGRVTARRPHYPEIGWLSVIVAFDHLPQEETLLRREIYAQQLRVRRPS
ncbi:MAG TPA: hypothetical protein VFT67_17060 [Jatrophihabitantaceae bacterium]|nr:hypothetical protein [Jatrophihabitantaceae bacterium]